MEKHANPCTPLTAAAMAGALQWPGQAFEAILEGTPYEEIPTTLEESRPSQVRRHPSQQADGDFTSRWTDAMNELVEVAEGIRRAENVHRVRRFAESVRDEEIQDWIEDRVQSMVKDAGYTPEQAFRALMGYDAPLRDGSDEDGDDLVLAADADTLEGDAPTSYVSRPGGAPAEDGEHLDG